MSKRKYSDREKAMYLLALEANGGNLMATERETGVPLETLRNWRDERGVNPDVAEIGNENRGDLVKYLKELAWKLAKALPDKIEEATLAQTATSLGIVIDKAQLLGGKPTEILELKQAAEDAIDYYIKQVEEKDGRIIDRQQAIEEVKGMSPHVIQALASTAVQ